MADGFLKDCFSPLVEWKLPEVREFTTSQEFLESKVVTQCSRSSPVDLGNYGKVILNRSKLKKHCRNSVSPNVRKRMWLDVVGVSDADSVMLVKAFGEPDEGEKYGEKLTSNKMLGLSTELSSFPSFNLRLTSFAPGLDRVVSALHRTLLQRSGGQQNEWEVFALLSHLSNHTAWLDCSRESSMASQSTLLSLLYSHAASTLGILERLKPDGMTQESFLNELTRNWFLWPFYHQPFWIAVRVIDMYLAEGPKILYRMALSGLKLFAVLAHEREVGETVTTRVQGFLSSLTSQQKARWFRDAFSIPRLSWKLIRRVWFSHLPQSRASSYHPANEIDGDSGESIDGGDAEQEQVPVIPDPSSELIKSPELWYSVWNWLPEWVVCKEPQCVFRASRDGYNLRTLYRKCDGQTCVLLLVKSTSGRVFGAFIASELSERHNNQFFGTGETFLFSLCPDVQCYKWSAENDLILRANDHELIVGSGGGAYGLWLDSDLNYGSSSKCSAFNNPSLNGVDEQFTCTSVEVYSCQ